MRSYFALAVFFVTDVHLLFDSRSRVLASSFVTYDFTELDCLCPWVYIDITYDQQIITYACACVVSILRRRCDVHLLLIRAFA